MMETINCKTNDDVSETLRTCRLCCQDKAKVVNLFSKIMYYEEGRTSKVDKLNDIISYLTKLEIAADDLPQEICFECVGHLFRARNFIEKCIKNDTMLRCKIDSRKNGKETQFDILVKAEQKSECSSETIDNEQIKTIHSTYRPFTYSNDKLSIANGNNIVKIELDGKKVEMLDCNSSTASDAFELADDMFMSLPEMFPKMKTSDEESKECKASKQKLKVKKKRKKTKPLQSRKPKSNTLKENNNEKSAIEKQESPPKDQSLKTNISKSKIISKLKMFTCTTCGASLCSKQNLKVHLKSHLDDRPFFCDQCHLKFKLKSHLTGHKRNVHNGEKNHFCSKCGKGFFSIAQYKFHMMTHTKEYPHQCILCDKRFAQRGNLKDHIKTHTGVRDVKCPYCPYITTSSNCLNSHIKGIHKNDKPMQCSECGLRFLYASGLKRHLSIHTGVKDFQCSHCEKQFRTAESFREHVRVHTKEKPYKCRYCEKQCRTYNHRLVHERVHTGSRPYICQVCKKGFTTNGNLKVHTKTHEKTFE